MNTLRMYMNSVPNERTFTFKQDSHFLASCKRKNRKADIRVSKWLPSLMALAEPIICSALNAGATRAEASDASSILPGGIHDKDFLNISNTKSVTSYVPHNEVCEPFRVFIGTVDLSPLLPKSNSVNKRGQAQIGNQTSGGGGRIALEDHAPWWGPVTLIERHKADMHTTIASGRYDKANNSATPTEDNSSRAATVAAIRKGAEAILKLDEETRGGKRKAESAAGCGDGLNNSRSNSPVGKESSVPLPSPSSSSPSATRTPAAYSSIYVEAQLFAYGEPLGPVSRTSHSIPCFSHAKGAEGVTLGHSNDQATMPRFVSEPDGSTAPTSRLHQINQWVFLPITIGELPIDTVLELTVKAGIHGSNGGVDEECANTGLEHITATTTTTTAESIAKKEKILRAVTTIGTVSMYVFSSKGRLKTGTRRFELSLPKRSKSVAQDTKGSMGTSGSTSETCSDDSEEETLDAQGKTAAQTSACAWRRERRFGYDGKHSKRTRRLPFAEWEFLHKQYTEGRMDVVRWLDPLTREALSLRREAMTLSPLALLKETSAEDVLSTLAKLWMAEEEENEKKNKKETENEHGNASAIDAQGTPCSALAAAVTSASHFTGMDASTHVNPLGSPLQSNSDDLSPSDPSAEARSTHDENDSGDSVGTQDKNEISSAERQQAIERLMSILHEHLSRPTLWVELPQSKAPLLPIYHNAIGEVYHTAHSLAATMVAAANFINCGGTAGTNGPPPLHSYQGAPSSQTNSVPGGGAANFGAFIGNTLMSSLASPSSSLHGHFGLTGEGSIVNSKAMATHASFAGTAVSTSGYPYHSHGGPANPLVSAPSSTTAVSSSGAYSSATNSQLLALANAGAGPSGGSGGITAIATTTPAMVQATAMQTASATSLFNAQNKAIALDNSISNFYRLSVFTPKCLVPYYDPELRAENIYEAKAALLAKSRILDAVDDQPSFQQRSRIKAIINRPPIVLEPMKVDDATLLWQYRHFLLKDPKAFIPFMSSLSWYRPSERREAERLVKLWRPIPLEDALLLLSRQFCMSLVLRKYAIRIIAAAADQTINLYLLQLVQSVRYDIEGEMTDFLVKRCSRNWELTSNLFWYVSVESDLEKEVARALVAATAASVLSGSGAGAAASASGGATNVSTRGRITPANAAAAAASAAASLAAATGNAANLPRDFKDREKLNTDEFIDYMTDEEKLSMLTYTRMRSGLVAELQTHKQIFHRRLQKQQLLLKTLLHMDSKMVKHCGKDRGKKIALTKEIIATRKCGIDTLFPNEGGAAQFAVQKMREHTNSGFGQLLVHEGGDGSINAVATVAGMGKGLKDMVGGLRKMAVAATVVVGGAAADTNSSSIDHLEPAASSPQSNNNRKSADGSAPVSSNLIVLKPAATPDGGSEPSSSSPAISTSQPSLAAAPAGSGSFGLSKEATKGCVVTAEEADAAKSSDEFPIDTAMVLNEACVMLPSHPNKAIDGITPEGTYVFKSAKMPVLLVMLESIASVKRVLVDPWDRTELSRFQQALTIATAPQNTVVSGLRGGLSGFVKVGGGSANGTPLTGIHIAADENTCPAAVALASVSSVAGSISGDGAMGTMADDAPLLPLGSPRGGYANDTAPAPTADSEAAVGEGAKQIVLSSDEATTLSASPSTTPSPASLYPRVPAVSLIGSRSPFRVIFKTGDDVRQDQLVIQFIELMDTLLKQNGLDLCLTPYRVLATSPMTGFVEVVPEVETFQQVQQTIGVTKYIQTHNPSPDQFDKAMDRFIKSCAGYCVITFLLGIGDRHLENLLITRDGRLLHIDFGFIFGKDPKPFPPPMKINKEMVLAIGGPQSEGYTTFKTYCCTAYNTLRKHSHLLLHLLVLMLDASIPDISGQSTPLPRPQRSVLLGLDGGEGGGNGTASEGAAKGDGRGGKNGAEGTNSNANSHSPFLAADGSDTRVNLLKVQDKLRVDLNDAEATQYIQNVIADSVGSIFTNLWDFVHIAAQAARN